jgi:hypothetical protein
VKFLYFVISCDIVFIETCILYLLFLTGGINVVNTLVSINPDLASSIALRYACQLAKSAGMVLQTMHVVEPEREGDTPGTGWVRRTWEKGLLETAQVEISRLINAERTSCPALGAPKMSIGVYEDEILRELDLGSYDLYLEGALYSFDSSGFRQKIRSKLYRGAPCPILLVKNLVSPTKIVLILEDEMELGHLISTFLRLFEGAKTEVDLIHCKFQGVGRVSFKKERGATSPPAQEKPDEILASAQSMLLAGGWSAKEALLVNDIPEKIADYLKDYGLVVSYIPQHPGQKAPLMELLNRVPSAILLCREQEQKAVGG